MTDKDQTTHCSSGIGAKPENDPSEPLLPSDIYPSLVELTIHGQDNKLNLFSGFLFFQSVLLLAWATVWQMDKSGRCLILALLSLFGSLSSVVWALLESDYEQASTDFSKAAADIEMHAPIQYRALAERRTKVLEKPLWKRGKFLIGFVTWGFAVLYLLLELILLQSHWPTT
jgi:hypothetical protein